MLVNANPILALAIIVLAGLAGGWVARLVRLPHVTGQILIGVLIGGAGLDLFGTEAVSRLDTVTNFALGVIALTIGDHLNLSRLRNAGKRLFILLLTESILTPVIVFAVGIVVLHSPWLPLLLAAMSISTAPATIVALIKESKSKGVFVKTLSAAVALNNIACIVVFAVARAFADVGLGSGGTQPFGTMIVYPLLQLLLAIGVGAVSGVILIVLTRNTVRTERLAAASIITLLVASGVALYLQLSLLLTCLSLGFTLANLTPNRRELGVQAFENMEPAIFAAFFTLAGMNLHFQHIGEIGLVAGLVFAGRFVGKIVSANVAMRFAGATERVRRYLGLALIPQAGVAVGLILLVQQDPQLTPLHGIVLAVGLTTVMVNELVGSITTSFALRKSGDAGKDRPRLIDFIQEENIVTNITAATKEEAIAKLTDVLISTNHLRVDRDRLLATFLERERQASTCVGAGLAIPHGILDEDRQMCGVMGLSRKGLAFETPDGRPVHCMVLLATPENERDRHLEVIAALARAIGRDQNIQDQLFNAETAAHAYEVLHAEEAEDFNYFLSDVEA